MRQVMLGIVIGALVAGGVVHAKRKPSPPTRLMGVSLWWSAKKAIRAAKRQGWRVYKTKKLSCGIRRVVLIRHGRSFFKASNLTLLVYRGKVAQISYMPKSSRAKVYNTHNWLKKKRRLERRHGTIRPKIIPLGNAGYTGWLRFQGQGRYYSMHVGISKRKPHIVREIGHNLKYLKWTDRFEKCWRRRRR